MTNTNKAIYNSDVEEFEARCKKLSPFELLTVHAYIDYLSLGHLSDEMLDRITAAGLTEEEVYAVIDYYKEIVAKEVQ